MTGQAAAVALRSWLASDSGRKAKDAVSLGLVGRGGEFLENRLAVAFLAGVKAAEDQAEADLRERLETMFFGGRR